MPRRPIAKPPTAERLQSLVRAFRGRTVATLGDLLADEFIYGRVERVSREAPVLILRYDQTIVVPGGAGNAAANVAALGGRAVLTARVGQDSAGRRVVASFPRGVSRDGLVRPRGYETPLKTRILAGGVHSAKQQVVRIDRIQASGLTLRRRARSSRRRVARSRAPTRCWCRTMAPASSRQSWSRRCAGIWRAPRAGAGCRSWWTRATRRCAITASRRARQTSPRSNRCLASP
jgi:hypothetical protein